MSERGSKVAMYTSRTPSHRKFKFGERVKVPQDIHSSCEATITGAEWGPDNHRSKTKAKGWIYYLQFEESSEAFIFSEEELVGRNHA